MYNKLIRNFKQNRYDFLFIPGAGFLAASLFNGLFIFLGDYIHHIYGIWKPPLLTPWFKPDFQHPDGIESYFLYGFTLLTPWLAMKFYSWLSYIHNPVVKIVTLSFFIFSAAVFIGNTGISIPCPAVFPDAWITLPATAIFTLLLFFIHYLRLPKKKWFDIILLLALIPICLVASVKASAWDYSFIFYPAWKLIHHTNINNIYFQYDYLLTLPAYLWLKWNLPLNGLQIVGQITLLFLFIGLYFFAKKLFYQKDLAWLLIVALVIVRSYANWGDVSSSFQTTPLRLDLWAILLFLMFRFGSTSIWLGISLSLLLLIHRNFGILYTLSFLEFLGFSYILNRNSNLWKKHWINLALIFSTVLVIYISRSATPAGNASIPIELIGLFTNIDLHSLFWYFPVVFSMVMIMIKRYQLSLQEPYSRTALFALLLATGNLVYFFGRSHPHNLINLSAILIFTGFLSLDLIIHIINISEGNNFPIPGKNLQKIYPSLVIILLAVMFYTYSDRIFYKAHHQLKAIKNLEWVQPDSLLQGNINVNTIRQHTAFARQVYFVSPYDFYYYYYGHYEPVDNRPCYTWVYRLEMEQHLQQLIDQGYHVVIHLRDITGETNTDNLILLNQLKFSGRVDAGEFVFISK